MSCKSVFCVIGIDQCDRDILNAIHLCRELDAHLSVLVVSLAPTPIGGYGIVVSAAWLLEREADIAAMKKREKQIISLVQTDGLKADVDSYYCEKDWADEIIGQRARFSDLTIIGPDLLHQPALKAPALSGTLFHSGRPTLVVPAGARPTLHPHKVMLAWDGRIEAVRAAREAIDVMAAAVDVHVTMINDDSADVSDRRANIAAYLARHGIKVKIDRLRTCGSAVADRLKQHATEIAADMIIMGAYGHSRLRERLFGGVTRSMIDTSPIPIFMMR
ncbi:universal stress protein [Phyllobacterium brassicacearum]|uniref:Universal stress protein n=1 Tax=Phyllobacterium brassicacearum TaxID=314235 RepID=A0A2P7B973_9HYPH|nr:universal stress protein [Phyllobacterium brassicacearum]PSH63024.1 universal stress protein [Phyllobacterium brassicacearum]TDQ13812.1 nucleotide-binding universal stress UspA family protein [Phyllobacterium brassicacearum]